MNAKKPQQKTEPLLHDDASIRESRLVFYRNDIEAIDAILAEFLRMSNARCALLVDKGGHMITQKGTTRSFDTDTISALVAGSFAATKEMARVLGEDEFTVLFHQGRSDNIQLSLVGDRTLFTVIFDDATTIGMVRLYAAETAKHLEKLFDHAENGDGERDADEEIGDDYSSSAQNRLDDVLGF
jgi:predicted regulator of Ras-like GTPase activity (Roadblock/LC7/MglB family)